ncbi:MAG TPA: hypothetical protein VF624_17320 [Tepidisphaeraceae bacterium]|jgi:hypothetical protein
MSSQPSLLLLWLLPAVFVVLSIAGLVLLRIGLRGRATDDHPLCAACGFDLFGKPDGVTQCGECGADVSPPAAVRVGHRERRARPLAAAVTCLLIAAFIGAPVLLGKLGAIDWQVHKPVWMLHRDAVSSNVVPRDLALRELARRYAVGKLSSRQLDALVESALAWQGDRSNVWQPIWGDFIEGQYRANRLSAEQKQRYARQVLVIDIVAAPTARRGQRIPVALGIGGVRGGPVWVEFDDATMTLSANRLRVPEPAAYFHGIRGQIERGSSWRRSQQIDLSPIEDRLPDGPVDIELKTRITLREGPDADSKIVTTFDRVLATKFRYPSPTRPLTTREDDLGGIEPDRD